MSSQKLILSQKQGLKISPRQIQFLHFLQLNEIELEHEIKKELEENPVLEYEEENEEVESCYLSRSHDNSAESKDGFFDMNKAVKSNIRVELKEQFQYLASSEKELSIADFIIDSVDEKGYLTYTLDELEDILSFGLNMLLNQKEISNVLQKLRGLEPQGLGTSGLQAFLTFQAREKNLNPIVISILEEHFDVLSERDFNLLGHRLGVSNNELRQYLKTICGFKPYPFYGFELSSVEKNETIIPEYKVDYRDGKLVYGTLTKNGKKLVFNENYGKEFRERTDKKLNKFLSEKKESAAWFIQAIEEREHTMNTCLEAVVKIQEAYFKSGSTSDLKPMVLKDVASLTGKTISTLSRVTSQKYVQTHFGLILLKSLFTEAIQRKDGELISNKEVQQIVSNLVSDENKRKPLTDSEICRKLASDGLNLTRRTITKYRENMNIPSSKLRRAL